MPLLSDTRHWRDKAEEARAVAGQLADGNARTMMLNIAAAYERLAELNQKWDPPQDADALERRIRSPKDARAGSTRRTPEF